jgi:hypothetical protein
MEGEDDTMEVNLIILNMQNIMFQTQLDIVNLATELGETPPALAKSNQHCHTQTTRNSEHR